MLSQYKALKKDTVFINLEDQIKFCVPPQKSFGYRLLLEIMT